MQEMILAPLQEALFTALDTAPSFTTYDTPPEGAVLPYVCLGDAEAKTVPSSGGFMGHEITQRIHVWSDAIGQMEAKQIMDDVAEHLAATPLVIAGHSVVLMRLMSADVTPQGTDQNQRQKGVLIYRIRTSANNA